MILNVLKNPRQEFFVRSCRASLDSKKLESFSRHFVWKEKGGTVGMSIISLVVDLQLCKVKRL